MEELDRARTKVNGREIHIFQPDGGIRILMIPPDMLEHRVSLITNAMKVSDESGLPLYSIFAHSRTSATLAFGNPGDNPKKIILLETAEDGSFTIRLSEVKPAAAA